MAKDHWKLSDVDNSDEIRDQRRTDSLSLVRRSSRKINIIRFSDAESKEHRQIKEDICRKLFLAGKWFITEAIFEDGSRADILVLDDMKIIEIAVTEKEESLHRKLRKYPNGLKLEVVYGGRFLEVRKGARKGPHGSFKARKERKGNEKRKAHCYRAKEDKP